MWRESKGMWGAHSTAGEEQKRSYSKELPCINESKPPKACALMRAELLCLGCLSQFVPASRACM